MDWSNERYVRFYVRETVGDVALTWEARAIWREILVKCDRAGVIGLDGHGVKGLAGLIRMPRDIVESHFQQLIDDGRIEIHGEFLVVPNYIEAQEATQSDKQRASESRSRRREKAMLGEILSQNETSCHKTNSGVTLSHSASQPVTPCRTVPYCTVPNRTVEESAHARASKPKRKQKTILPSDWEPKSEHKAIAIEQGVDLEAQAELFKDHWKGNGETKADWDATFRNWLRRAPEFSRGRQGPKHSPRQGSIDFLRREMEKANEND